MHLRYLTAFLLCTVACGPAPSGDEPVNTECFCLPRVGFPNNTVPKNPEHLVDGVRFDLDRLTFRFIPTGLSPGDPVDEPFLLKPLGTSGMYAVVPDDLLQVDELYGLGALLSDTYPEGLALGAGIRTVDYVDTTPPTIGQLRLTGDVFENRCGAKALFIEDSGTGDDFAVGTRFPVLVTFRSGDREFQSVTGTFGFTNTVNKIVVARAPYLGDCITDIGLESFDFAFGEDVEVTMVVYDYAGNASEPVSQTIKWPIEDQPSGGGGCSASDLPRPPGDAYVGVFLFVLVLAGRRRVSGRERSHGRRGFSLQSDARPRHVP
ncbi:MAG: hypothetical protein WBG86_08760 [Polyangiales bacterium]